VPFFFVLSFWACKKKCLAAKGRKQMLKITGCKGEEKSNIKKALDTGSRPV